MLLSRDDILKSEDLETREVDVPEWGGTVLVRGLTGHERNRYEASVTQQRGKHTVTVLDDITAKLVAACIVDADGKRLFTEGDIGALSEKSGAALQRVADVALELSGMTSTSDEDAEENSEAAPSGGSTSA